MEGFDKEWHFTSSRKRFANYTNLEPGKYIFRVKATNNDGVWNNRGTSIAITITPPFYETWWFITLLVVVAFSIIGFAIWIRFKQILAIEKLKASLAADLHDNIGSGLTEISILSELSANMAKTFSPDAANQIEEISEKARQLVDNMSDIVWFINPSRDTIFDFAVRLKDSYADLLSQLGIHFKTVNLEKLKSLKLPLNYKQNLYLIFKEALNNAIKHSGCKRIEFRAEMRENKLYLCLSDDGKGIEKEEDNLGNGLINMKKRAAEIGGELVIITGEKGTRIEFIGKIKKSFKLNS